LSEEKTSRRSLLASAGAWGVGAMVGAGTFVALARGALRRRNWVWQIDPAKCTRCGNCATHCVLSPSAVKCIQSHVRCGYCERCFAFFAPEAEEFTSAAENQLCPTGAISRRPTHKLPYYRYNVDEALCIGCGLCVEGCERFGNGSLYLQVRHDRCLNCNECAIAAACPADAFVRVPADRPYLFKKGYA